MAAISPGSIDWIRQLIQIDTVSRNSNLGLIEAVRDYLRGLGIECHLTHDATKTKANLFCSVPDARGCVDGGVVLSGHTDVVPVDDQNWDSDPFMATVRDGRVYGRGSADMKGFIAVVLAQMPNLLQRSLRIPIHLAFSYDEEVGCAGAPLLIADLKARGIHPSGCIVGEPTNMQLVVGHKGFSAHRCRVTGRAAHSSVPAAGVNAIDYAAQLVTFIRKVSDDMRREGPFDHAFDVPYSTMQTSSVAGGGVVNTVPAFCSIEFLIRNLPDVDAEQIFELVRQHARGELLSRMRAEGADDNVDILFETPLRVPGLKPDENEFTRFVRALSADDATRKVAYGTEAGLFQQAGIPTVVCGPGDIRQAHRENEYLSLAQIEQCEKFLLDLTQSLTL